MLRNSRHKYLYFGLTICLTLFLYAAPLFAGDATLSWEPPTTNTDGTPLTDLAGHIVYYGTSSGNYSQSIDVDNVTTYQVTNLTDGFTYYFIVTAYDTLGNESESSDEVSKTIPLLDITPPTVTITLPTSGSTFATNSNNFNIGGTASANVGVTQVTWSNSSGGSGTASGTTSWSVNGIALQSGINVITITAGDAAGNTGTDALTVTYNPPVSTPTADFTASTTYGIAPLTVNFTNNSTGSGQPLSYRWDFDNNGTIDSTTSDPSYIYNNAGTYTVKLTVTDSDGDQDTLTRTDYITVTPSTPSAYTLTVSINGNGTVMSSPSGINCGSVCTEDYTSGTVVTLTATPDSGWGNFSGWTGACNGIGTCQVTMDSYKTVTATFTGTLMFFSDDFNDGNDNGWTVKSGTWAVEGGEYSGTSASIDAPAFSVINTETRDMTIDVDCRDLGTGEWQNCFIVFAYGEDKGKAYWAGARVGGNMWSIEEMDINTGTWSYLASIPETINTGTWYSLKVIVSGDTVTLYVDGLMRVSYTFAGGMPVGKVGLGGQGNHAHYDNFSVNAGNTSPPSSYSDDFNDGNDNGWTRKSGKWAVKGGEYSGTSASIDAPAFSVINTETQDMTIDVDCRDLGTGEWQNCFIVFAYGEDKGKAYWAGARVGGNMWSIEEMDIDTGTWSYLASIPETINTGTWYSLKVIVSGDTVTLYADGLMKVSYTFPGGMPVGKVGLGGQGNHAHYDDFLVDSGTSPSSSYSDDFNDGSDNGWIRKSGKWAVKGGEYSETSASIDAPAFSVINTETQDVTIDVDASDQGTGAYQSFFIVFAYDESNRKAYWAGARVGGNMWSIEEMDIDTGTWSYLASIPETINTGTWYSLRVIVSGDTVTLYVDGLMKVSYTFAGGMPVGKVGLGGQGNHAHFDDLSVNY